MLYNSLNWEQQQKWCHVCSQKCGVNTVSIKLPPVDLRAKSKIEAFQDNYNSSHIDLLFTRCLWYNLRREKCMVQSKKTIISFPPQAEHSTKFRSSPSSKFWFNNGVCYRKNVLRFLHFNFSYFLLYLLSPPFLSHSSRIIYLKKKLLHILTNPLVPSCSILSISWLDEDRSLNSRCLPNLNLLTRVALILENIWGKKLFLLTEVPVQRDAIDETSFHPHFCPWMWMDIHGCTTCTYCRYWKTEGRLGFLELRCSWKTLGRNTLSPSLWTNSWVNSSLLMWKICCMCCVYLSCPLLLSLMFWNLKACVVQTLVVTISLTDTSFW